MEARGRRQLPYVVAAIATLSVAALAAVAVAPALLIHSPLSLIALSPNGRHLLLVAPLVAPVAFVVVAATRRTVAAFLAFRIGQIYGDQALQWVERKSTGAGRWLRLLENWFERAGIPLLVLAPGMTTAGLAGASGMAVWRAVPLLFIGQTLWMSAVYFIGEALRDWTFPVISFIQAYMWEATFACLLAVVAYEIHRRRTGRSIVPGLIASSDDSTFS